MVDSENGGIKEVKMEQEQREKVTEFVSEMNIVRANMEKHGGHFAKALANALFYADLENAYKIKATWADMWNLYLEWK